MKAVVLKQIGPITELKKNLVIEDIPIPLLTPDEVLIQVKYASLNHRDLWITKGLYAGIKLPVVPGSDCSGVIHQIGDNVTNLNVGDEVIINPSINWGENQSYQSREFKILGLPDNGTLAEYLKINSKYVFPKPSHLSLEEAAALPLAGLTAYRALFTRAKLTANENLLITGIGGGVATFALLFATAIGANSYITSGNPDKISQAIKLGAKDGVEYLQPDWDTKLLDRVPEGFDVAFDGTGGTVFNKCINLLKPGGRLVSYGATLGNSPQVEIRKIFWKQLNIFGSTMGSDQDFKAMYEFICNHKIKPVIDSVFTINNIHSAFEKMDASSQLGKIIIQIKTS